MDQEILNSFHDAPIESQGGSFRRRCLYQRLHETLPLIMFEVGDVVEVGRRSKKNLGRRRNINNFGGFKTPVRCLVINKTVKEIPKLSTHLQETFLEVLILPGNIPAPCHFTRTSKAVIIGNNRSVKLIAMERAEDIPQLISSQ